MRIMAFWSWLCAPPTLSCLHKENLARLGHSCPYYWTLNPHHYLLITMKVPCTYPGCTKQFASVPNCRRHVKTCHLGIRRHECEACFARFSSRQNLALHMYKHQRQAMAVPAGTQAVGRVEVIPKLTTMVEQTKDPELRPFTKVMRIYPFPVTQEKPKLPKINKRRQIQSASQLPSPRLT